MLWMAVLGPTLLFSCYSDWRWRKIKNVVTVPLLFSGWLVSLFVSGTQGLWSSLTGSFLCAALGAMGGSIGMGDVKLLLGVGAWLPPPLRIYFASSLLAARVIGALAVRYAASGRNLRPFLYCVLSELRLGGLGPLPAEYRWPGAWAISAAVAVSVFVELRSV